MNFLEELRAFFAGVSLEKRKTEELKNMLTRIGEHTDDADDAALTEFEQRTAEIIAEIDSRANAAASGIEQRRAEVRASIANGTAREILIPSATTEQRHYDASSPEYRDAWLKNIAVDREGRRMFGDLTDVEQRAFTMTTANSGEVVPTDIMNEIVDLMENDAPLLADATRTNFTRGFGVPRRNSIKSGDADVTKEGVANANDEENEFNLLALDGEEIKKHVSMSRKMEIQSIQAFRTWIVTELAERMKVAIGKLLYTRLDDTYDVEDNADGVGMAAENVLTGTLTDAELLKVLGQLKGGGARRVYANDYTIYNVLAALHEEDGTKLFIPNSREDMKEAGRVYGSAVRPDENLADNVLYIGYPKELLVNFFEDINIMSDMDVKSRVRTWSGYALVDAGLKKPKAFAKYTHTTTVSGG